MIGMWAVYTLSDETGVRYVGVSKNPTDRLARHIREAKHGGTHRKNWIKSLTAPPAMAIVEWVSDWDEAERRWVAHYRGTGCNLVNANDGGKTMHQTRKAPTYPNVKRAWRIMESSKRSVYRLGTSDMKANIDASTAKFSGAVAKLRSMGRLHVAEAYYASKFAGR